MQVIQCSRQVSTPAHFDRGVTVGFIRYVVTVDISEDAEDLMHGQLRVIPLMCCLRRTMAPVNRLCVFTRCECQRPQSDNFEAEDKSSDLTIRRGSLSVLAQLPHTHDIVQSGMRGRTNGHGSRPLHAPRATRAPPRRVTSKLGVKKISSVPKCVSAGYG